MAKMVIRPRQPVLTNVVPHQGNDRVLIPKRKAGTPVAPTADFRNADFRDADWRT